MIPRIRQAPHGAIGVEMEMEGGKDRVAKLHSVVCSDGSLEDGGEVKIVASCCRVPMIAAHVAELASHLGCDVSYRCGLHVHLDMRALPRSRQDRLGKWLLAHQDWWYSIIPPRRRDNCYVKPVAVSRPSDHYSWFNFTRYSTCEIRVHPGTCNPHKVYSWLRFMRLITHRLRDDSWWTKPDVDPFAMTPMELAHGDGYALHYLQEREENDGLINSIYRSPLIGDRFKV